MFVRVLDYLRKELASNTYRVVAPIVGLALGTLLSQTGLFQRVEYLVFDVFAKARHRFDAPPDARLFLVGIDDATVRKLGQYPLPRTVHGQLLASLANLKPGVVTWDIVFDVPQDPDNDRAFVQGVEQMAAPVVTGATSVTQKGHGLAAGELTEERLGMTRPLRAAVDSPKVARYKWVNLPIPELSKVSLFGMADCPPWIDGIRRRIPFVSKIGDEYYPSLVLQTLLALWSVSAESVTVIPGVAVDIDTQEFTRSIPINERGEYLLNYRYETDDFQSLSYLGLSHALLSRFVLNKEVEVPDLGGRIVLIGEVAATLTDLGPSPLAPRSPLPLVHLNALDNILKEDYLRHTSPWVLWAGWLVAAYVLLRLLEEAGVAFSLIAPGVVVVAFVLITLYLFVQHSIWVPIALPVLTFSLVQVGEVTRRALLERRARQQIKSTFSSYVAPNVMEEILKDVDQLRLGGIRKPVTILFSDIRGFTTLSESCEEEEFVEQLNQYFTSMVDCVNRYGGTLHKFIGDAIMAVWGDTVSQGSAEDAANAVAASLDMRRELEPLNDHWLLEGRPTFHVGVGLNHGGVLVGNIGAPQRKEFTVIGDAVNLASRIEGLSKEFSTDLVVGESVAGLTEDLFHFQTLGVVQVKGKTKPIRVYAVIGRKGEEELSRPVEWLQRYEEAFDLFLKREFEQASARFGACLENQPEDWCCRLYRDQCREFLATPPPDDWVGIKVMTSK